MKYFNLSLIFVFSLLLSSCSNDSVIADENMKANSQEIAQPIKQFEESVAVSILKTAEKSKGSKVPVRLKLTDYSGLDILHPVYRFNGFEFSDTGKFNDEIAGDGIYTSVELIGYNDEKSSAKAGIFLSDNFKYRDQLPANKIFDCKIEHVPCPADGGLVDSDWGTGWGCFKFSDCRIGF